MQQYSDFDLDKATADAWQAFGERLAEVLASMDETADLRIDALEGETDAGFVVFRLSGEGTLRAEAASTAELGEDHLLTPSQLQAMEDAGWEAPSAEGSHRFTAQVGQDEAARLAEILTQRPDEGPRLSDFDPEDVVATVPASREHLDAMVSTELQQLLGAPAIRDSDGDYALRVGSTMVFVRATPDAREVVVFAAVVHDIEGRSRAAELLNDLNAEARFVRFELLRDRVFVQMSVLAHPFVPAHLLQAVKAVSEVADGVDEELARKLHGRTTFDEG